MAELDRHIVGQSDAKRAVAIALRNRWRRQQLPEDLRQTVTPKNILMIGPTGCGKTEIARRLASLVQAPFIKVEATKFTEVGFHGRDVDMIIRDLMDAAVAMVKKNKMKELEEEVKHWVREQVLQQLIGVDAKDMATKDNMRKMGKSFRDLLAEGELDDVEITVSVPADKSKGGDSPQVFSMDPAAMSQQSTLLEIMGKAAKMGGKGKTEEKKLPIKEARAVLFDAEMERRLEEIDFTREATTSVEQNGIVFLDEIDKIVSNRDYRSADASAEGVQRDLLPLVEGSTISTKYGNIDTDHILFIASGAFHSVKPSDMLPELQGRLPIRVELQGLSEDDFYRILTEPEHNVVRQQQALIATEGVDLNFKDEAVKEVARVASECNRTVENIGARRLFSVMERIMDEHSFDAADMDEGTEVSQVADQKGRRSRRSLRFL